ncbi:hypothetical protein HDU83_001325 [Entophlyctis luteolus]|nr:hypothetical protein HDU83_001325 [Entophlyctis luteolus]
MSLVSVTARIYFHLAPCFIGDFTRGIKSQLDSYLMRYIPELKGVPLAYSNIKILDDAAKVLFDSPFCHVYASVNFVMFAPRIGSLQVGVVNKVSSDHIGLLVHGVFNASITSEHIRHNEYKFNNSTKSWKRYHPGGSPTGEAIAPGSVVRMPASNGMLTLSGSLRKHPKKTGLVVLDADSAPVSYTTDLNDQSADIHEHFEAIKSEEAKTIYLDVEAVENDTAEDSIDEWNSEVKTEKVIVSSRKTAEANTSKSKASTKKEAVKGTISDEDDVSSKKSNTKKRKNVGKTSEGNANSGEKKKKKANETKSD